MRRCADCDVPLVEVGLACHLCGCTEAINRESVMSARAGVYHDAARKMDPQINAAERLVRELLSAEGDTALESLLILRARQTLLELQALQQELRQVARALGAC